eukprot:TRINITY_DN26680_c0_g1_i1.p1 TRINITY_DN26680_c0_g1~~TRINITY_DN26680_c0_g1_i1.p1  ORF type:complete len:538 (-),score=150.79 TRINITY_DN26680_c0_g1_i1:8-1621(-)
MFLNHISKQLHLIPEDPCTNVLLHFSLPVKKILVGQTVTFLLDSASPPPRITLPTPTHVDWTLECVGQGFSLPIEDHATIDACIELYRRWLFDQEHRPPPVADDASQGFIQKMLKHFSLLFGPRRYTEKDQFDHHARLCHKVLDLFTRYARTSYKSLSAETWEVWLRLLLGITDCLFLRTIGGESEALSQALASHMFQVVFESWLLSQTRSNEMWSTLATLIKNWLHVMALMVEWNAICSALAGRVFALLYGPAEGTSQVVVRREQVSSLSLADDFVFFAWYRMLHIVGNPNALLDPRIYLKAMEGVQSLVSGFLNVVNRDNSKKPHRRVNGPDGNTILHIFGGWLFEALKLSRPNFEDGTALAVETMCDLFHVKRHSKFDRLYLASYYDSLADALQKEGKVMLSCLLHSKHFFADELDGCRVLLPHFIYALSTQLTKSKSGVSHFDQVRGACVRILASLLSLPAYYGQTRLHMRLPREVQAREEAALAVEILSRSAGPSESVPPPEMASYAAVRLSCPPVEMAPHGWEGSYSGESG